MRSNNRDETFERWRQRMLDETSRFIEWGLNHPDEVEWIPAHPVGRGSFTERAKTLFWTLLLANRNMPD